MTVLKMDNVFSDTELNLINSLLRREDITRNEDGTFIQHDGDEYGYGIHSGLGRLQYRIEDNQQFSELRQNLAKKINALFGVNLSSSGAYCAEYSAEFGTPNLPVHWDHDNTEIIFNYQLSSTTSWDIGVDKDIYSMEDNTALVFNPNKYTHWRPHKTFKEGEYVKMIFFRFTDFNNPSDYAHLDYSIGHDVFAEINAFRDSLKQT